MRLAFSNLLPAPSRGTLQTIFCHSSSYAGSCPAVAGNAAQVAELPTQILYGDGECRTGIDVEDLFRSCGRVDPVDFEVAVGELGVVGREKCDVKQ